MAKLIVTRIIRSGRKSHSRVETSDGHQLVIDHSVVKPYVGMELDIEDLGASKSELRPLRKGDRYPELLPASDVV